eukprot:gb/GFBE01012400.1/.p1 GENE.gb/GFBE01012400.1/~~gb/GFBE01012400.1/.p1  ORF type:complete len:681 (+),score=115.71 gb/GFBE01012400.1/:1-2043(+)
MAGSGKGSFISRTIGFLCKAVRAGLTPSLVSYFFWIAGVTTMFGAFAMISFAPLSSYLCNIPGEFNETSGQTVGCANCSDMLMLCGKDACFRHAFNLTWQLHAATPDGTMYGAFQEAVLDQTCNSLAQTADSPVSMLNAIIAKRAKSGNAEPSEACEAWSCKVMTMALMRSQNTVLTRPGSCTNEMSVKPPWEDTTCSCDSMVVRMQEAKNFQELCGSMADGLQVAVYNRMMANKDMCLQSSMAVAAIIDPPNHQLLQTEVNCFNVLSVITSLPEWFDAVYYIENLDPIAQPAGWLIQAYCRKIYCLAWEASLVNEQCDWAGAENLASVGDVISDVASVCTGEELDFSQAYLCSQSPFNTSAYCPQPAAAGGRRLSNSTDSRRRFRSLDMDVFAPPPSPAPAVAKAPQVAEIPRIMEYSHNVLQEAMVASDGSLEDVILAEEIWDDPDSDEESYVCEGDFCSSRARRLTAAAAPATNNDELQEWTVTPWSKCTCYQQCTPGVTTRSVSCPVGVKCKEPKPTSAKSCVCKHCSDCDVTLFVLGAAGAYGFTGFLCGLLWLAFMAVAMFEEDDYTGMSLSLKCLGCFCRFLPAVIKIMTYITMFFVILLVVTALVPIGETFSDCKNSTSMNQLAMGGIVVWVIQIAVGVYMHRFKPMPPWLHSAPGSKAMKLLCKPFKCVGP